MRAPRQQTPVIALTGHLGAGKTSLLNHLLRQPGARLGVVVNDFGSLNVDAALVTGQVDEAAAISGGCLCCLPDSGGLDDALEQLSAPRLRLDAILVEASGVADPLNLARIIRFSGAEHVRPGGLVDVIDSVEHFSTVDTLEHPPARYQATSLVVIGKTDLLPESERSHRVQAITERVHQMNPHAVCVVAVNGGVDPDLILDYSSHEDPPDQLPIARLMREQAADVDHQHARSVSVELDAPVDAGALNRLLENPPRGAYRMKGRIRVRKPGGVAGFLINVVGSQIHVAPYPVSAGGELVAIGLDLDESEAQRRLAAVAASGSNSLSESGADAVGQDDGGRDDAAWRRLQRYEKLSR